MKVDGYDGRKELTLVAFRSREELLFCFIVSTTETGQVDMTRLKGFYLDVKKDVKQVTDLLGSIPAKEGAL